MKELSVLVKLAAPLALAQVGQVLMGFVDVAIVGRLGTAPLAAVGLGNGLFFAFSVLGLGVLMGLDPLISQALGAGEQRRARALLWQGVWLAVAVGAVLSLPIALCSLWLEAWGVVPEVAREARTYVLFRLPALVPMMLFTAQRSFLQSHRATRWLVVAIVTANVANFALDWVLVLGVPPYFSGLGTAGVSLATVGCTVLQVGIMAFGVRRVTRAQGGAIPRRPVPAQLAQALKVGLPVGLQLGAEFGVFALAGLLAARMSAEAAAAHQVALTLSSLTFCAAMGVGSAGGVLVGHAVGAGDGPRARRAGTSALLGGGLVMAVSALGFLLAPAGLTGLLTDLPEVLPVAVPLLAVAAAFQLSDGLQVVGGGILRGAGDTRFCFLANVAGHWLVGLPVALLCAHPLGMGLLGLWWGLAAGLTVVAVVLVLRFYLLTARPVVRLDVAPQP